MSKPIILYENMRAAAYIPYYLADTRAAFASEGVEVEIRTSPATHRTAEALLEGEADVSWGGPMRVMLHHDRDPDCPLVCFCQVVGREPFMLIGREPNPTFRFTDLKNARIGTVSEVPTPWMCFQDDLQRAGIEPASLKRMVDGTMGGNVAALRAGDLDVIQVFEPYADDLLASGDGHLWHAFAERGDIAYTTFYTTRRFAEQNRETCIALTRAMAKTQTALFAEPADTIASAVAGYFPDQSTQALARIINRYRDTGVWARSTALPTTPVVRLKAALISGGLISRDMPYERVVADGLSDVD
jgi:NitT/TauT family transport system substrate-binding protein